MGRWKLKKVEGGVRREKCKEVLRKVRGARLCKDKEQDNVFGMMCVIPNDPTHYIFLSHFSNLGARLKSLELG